MPTCSCAGSRTSSPASAATPRSSSRWRRRSKGSASTGSRRWLTAATTLSPAQGDLASYLLHASFDDRPLTDTEILDMLTVLVLAGLDTTRAELGYMFRHLATHPEHRQALIDDPQLIPSAVEEVLRYYTIIFGDGRKVTRDLEFHGVQLKRGDMVYGLVSAANRDPARLRAGGRVHPRPQAQQPHGLRERAAPLPRPAPRAARDADRGRGVAARDPRLPDRRRLRSSCWSAEAAR